MVLQLVSAKINEEDVKRKHYSGRSWRFIIEKGLTHVEQCQPRQQEIEDNWNKVQRTNSYLKLLYILKNKYPKVYDEIIEIRNATR